MNEYICLKLSLVSEIVAEIPLLQMMQEDQTDESDVENFTAQQSSIMASLAFIGADDSRFLMQHSISLSFCLLCLIDNDGRPRLGGSVVTESGSRGTVCKINVHGKLMVQMEAEGCSGEVRKLSLLTLRSSGPAQRFRLDRLTSRNEDAVRVAASLFTLVAKDFRC